MSQQDNIFSTKLCDERHTNITCDMQSIQNSIEKLDKRLNWFYIICLITLGTSLANLAINNISKKSDNEIKKTENVRYVNKANK